MYWLDFSPDGKRLITGGEDTVAIVWDLSTGQPVFKLPMPTGRSNEASFSPDGTRLLTSDTSQVARVWDAATGKLLLELSGHSGAVYGTAWSADGKCIATGSADKTAKIWDAETGEDLLTLYGHTAVVGGVAFSPDGTRLATISDDGTARIYVLPIEELMALAKTRVTRTLTTEECQRYMHLEHCPEADYFEHGYNHAVPPDILILGGGPAGLSTALHLLQHDPQLAARILVLEKARYPRHKLCGGGLTSDAEVILEGLGLDVSEIPHVDAAEAHLDFAARGS